jgi:sulfatase maturation enzyme AslB (radical SAM superfamily)
MNYRLLNLIHTTPWLADIVYSTLKLSRGFKTVGNFDGDWLKHYHFNPNFSPNFRLCVGATDQCNARCVFCAHSKVKAERGYMSLETFEFTAHKWKDLGGKEIDFTVSVGEPMLDSNLWKKIEIANTLSLKTSFTTNGTLLERDDNYIKVVSYKVSEIHISLDIPETYQQSFGTNQAQRVWNGVNKLLAYNKLFGSGDLSIILRFRSSLKPSQIIKSESFQTVVRSRLSNKVKVYFTDAYDNWGGLINKSDMIGSMTLVDRFVKPRVPCQNLFQPAIEWNGNIRLCACRTAPGTQDLVVGNVYDTGLDQAVTSLKGVGIINSFVSGSPPTICQNCTMYRPVL